MRSPSQKVNQPNKYLKPKPVIMVMACVILLLGCIGNQHMHYLYVFTDQVMTDYYKNQEMASPLVNQVISKIKVERWRYYVMNASLLIIKVSVISVALCIGFELADKAYSLGTNLWLVVCSEYMSLIYSWYKFYGLALSDTIDLESALTYAPLSLLSITNHTTSFWWYTLGSINLFQLAQAMVLAVLTIKHYRHSWQYSFKVAMVVYGVCWFLWVVLVTSLLFYGQDFTK